MQVVLLERVRNLGAIGDVVEVRNGFARNWLLPQGKALRATKQNIAYFEAQRVEIEKRNAERRADAETHAKDFDGLSVVVIRQAGETGQLYGSVSTRDVSDALTEQGHQVSRADVRLDRAIKAIGLHEVEIQLHPEVVVTVSVNVARSSDEAERQARGENVLQPEPEPIDEATDEAVEGETEAGEDADAEPVEEQPAEA